MVAATMTERAGNPWGPEHPPAKASVRVARQLELDQRAATQKFGIIGRSEAGKTYLAGRLVEQLHAVGCQVIILDPVGVWWGLTLAANGKDAGLPFVVFGGRRGHLRLSADSGRRVARAVVEQNLSAVIDLTGLRKRRRPGGRGAEPESELQRFLADFQEEALDASQRDPRARMVVYDEAQMMLPQVVSSGGERMLGTGEDLVRTGRNSGWGFVLMSQRPQSINKEVLSQVECFFVGQLTEPHARNRLKEWIVEKKADVRTELDDLVKLERGEFYVWSPQWLQTFKKVRVLPKWTFDASRTPELGDLLVPGAARLSSISAIDLEALRQAIDGDGPADPVEPKDGGTRRAQLDRERELALLKAERHVEQLQRELAEQRQTLRDIYTRLGALVGQPLEGAAASASPSESTSLRAEPNGSRRGGERATRDAGPAPRPSVTPPEGAPIVDKCQRALMTVLIQQGKALSMRRLGMMAVYAPTSGGFKNAVSKLRKRGWVEGRGEVQATRTGTAQFVAEFGSVPKLPRGSKLFEFWLQHARVDKCGRAVLTALRKHGGGPMAPVELARRTEPPYAASSGGFKNTLSKLRTLGVIEGRGEVTLAEDLI